jgi:hypothetical protein
MLFEREWFGPPAKVEHPCRVGQLGEMNVRRQTVGKRHDDLAQPER